ncbi:MAG: Rrf2 family transcriptional regulator [Pseudomonadota bacterium]
MLRLSAAARYGLSLAIEVGRQGQDSVLSLGEVSRRTGISRRYLDKLAAAMREHALIVGHNGRRGGYKLARAATGITLADIIEATSGPVNIVECVLHPGCCKRSADCPCRAVYQVANARVLETLNSIRLSDLVESARQVPHQVWACPPGMVASVV